nr:hypothetical protein [uncultured Mucilaginibacter sp.]
MNFDKRAYFGALALLLFIGCSKTPATVQVKKLQSPNPTSRLFKMPAKQLHDTLLALFDFGQQYDNPTLKTIFMDAVLEDTTNKMQATFSTETSAGPVFSEAYFAEPGTKNDIYITTMASYWYSPMYFADDKPLKYTSAFAFKLKELSKDSTLLSVVAINPEIVNGTKCCGPHGNYSITQKVKPTSVEEYTLIMFVAQKLGIKDMPALKLPR